MMAHIKSEEEPKQEKIQELQLKIRSARFNTMFGSVAVGMMLIGLILLALARIDSLWMTIYSVIGGLQLIFILPALFFEACTWLNAKKLLRRALEASSLKQ